jgi:hypothetical protein
LATFYETVLPSGRCVRFTALKTRQKLDLERRIAQMKGDGFSSSVQTVATCVVAYTDPQPMEHMPLVDDKGKEVEGVTVVDIDKTLDKVPENAWRKTSFLELTSEGSGHCTEVFDRLPDWEAVCQAITRAAGYGEADVGLMAGKARTRSDAR